MATHLLALHRAGGWVSVAVAESTLRSLRITGLATAPVGSPELAALVTGRRWDRVVATLPARAAYYRFLDLPFRDHRRLAQAVGPALEEHVPLSLDDGVTTFDAVGPRRRNRVLAAMVRRTQIEELASEYADLAIAPSQWVWEPTAVLAAYQSSLDAELPTVIVDVGIDSSIVAAYSGHELMGIRVISAASEPGFARDLGWAVRTLETNAEHAVLGGRMYETAASIVAGELDGIRVETLSAECPAPLAERAQSGWRSLTSVVGLTLAAAGNADPPMLSFASGGGEAQTSTSERRDIVRRIAPWAGATVALLGLAAGIDAARLVRDASRLDHAAERIFTTAMPGTPGGAGRRMKLELKLSELERRQTELAGGVQADSALGILVAMSESIPSDLEVEFESFAYDPPNVRLRGQGASFETVTRVQQLLRESTPYNNVDVGDVRSAASGAGVQFELTIRLGEPRPAT